jgi:UDP-N-acetylglucosamine 2-epimerase (non-hydrolysing)
MIPSPHRVAFVFGTRPEAIKLAPVIRATAESRALAPHICVTGQHREMLDQVLEVFGIVPDVDFALMRPNQTLADITARTISAVDGYLRQHAPDMVIVQGDTTAVFCAALCAFYRRIPVGHVEAGLRTWDKLSPFPEEINRVLATRVTDLHFAPTESARENLRKECVEDARIVVTGNTVIDALQFALAKIRLQAPAVPGLPPALMDGERPLVLITGHRRESFGDGIRNVCVAIAALAQRFATTEFVYPVHLNPNVREPVYRLLADRPNVHLIEPVGYLPFVALMNRAKVILTDSGGVQEEAPSLGKPVLVMRDTTERPEAVAMGTVRLVGTDVAAIVEGVSTLLADESSYAVMASAVNPYGDGKASRRIVEAVQSLLAGRPSPARPAAPQTAGAA